MRGRARPGRRRRRGLWYFISRLFGPPRGRHVMGAPPPPPETAVDPLAPVASIRLIFTDGSVVELPEGSAEESQAQYLALRVLEAGRRA